MNILELDSYNLADAVKFNDHLNPILWGSDEQLKPEVREKLLAIADEFREFLGVNDLQLKDITISGSNAAYTYTPHSDIDLHLVVDLPEADRNEVYRECLMLKNMYSMTCMTSRSVAMMLSYMCKMPTSHIIVKAFIQL